jgi:hypothetical protein
VSCAETHDAEGMCACVAWLLVSTCAAGLGERRKALGSVLLGGRAGRGALVDSLLLLSTCGNGCESMIRS